VITKAANILPSPAASVASGRLLPHVPRRFVVPRVSAQEFRESRQRVSFEDENNAVTHLGEESGDSNGNGAYDDPQQPVDLIDEIGPAPEVKTATNMVMDHDNPEYYGDLLGSEVIPDTYSSLQRGPRDRGRQSRREAFQHEQNSSDQFVYGTYRPHNRHRIKSSKHEYNNFATSFDDEFDLFSRSKPEAAAASSYRSSTSTRVQSQNLPSNSATSAYHLDSSSDQRTNNVILPAEEDLTSSRKTATNSYHQQNHNAYPSSLNKTTVPRDPLTDDYGHDGYDPLQHHQGEYSIRFNQGPETGRQRPM
jgi:hypothetical protein